eukprot:Opistho-2@92161
MHSTPMHPIVKTNIDFSCSIMQMLSLASAQVDNCAECVAEVRPVCARVGGVNGTRTTFDNACLAECNNGVVVRDGTCEMLAVEPDCFCTLEPRPVCAIRFLPRGGAKRETMTNDCVAKCEHAEILHDGVCAPLPKFPTAPCIASKEFRPVCGQGRRDGVTRTFANAQAAWCANAVILRRGDCNSTAEEDGPSAPGPDGHTPRPDELPEELKPFWPNQHDSSLFPVGRGGQDDSDCTGPQQGPQGPQQGGMGPQQGGMGPQQGGMGPQQGGMGPQQGGMGPQQGGMGPQQGG